MTLMTTKNVLTLNESEFKDNTMKKHVNNVIYYSFVPLCIHALVCILTPVYQSFCLSKFAETCYQAASPKSILKKISTRAPFVIIEDLHIKIRAESKRAQFNYFNRIFKSHKKVILFNNKKIYRICVNKSTNH